MDIIGIVGGQSSVLAFFRGHGYDINQSTCVNPVCLLYTNETTLHISLDSKVSVYAYRKQQ